jgi:hypothetical protein
MVGRVLSCVLGGLAMVAACVEDSPPEFGPPPSLGGSGGSSPGAGGLGAGGDVLGLDAGTQSPPPADASGYCGNQIHQITQAPPTVYFLFDISGSMATPVSGGTRFSVVQAAAARLVRDLRYVIRAGAAAFPLQVSTEPCHVGAEIYAPRFDDPAGFDVATASLRPYGGTPTAATLAALGPGLSSIPGKTIVVLATDGGPNCNAGATCSLAECTENIEGCVPGDTCCADAVNCCAPGGPAGPSSCIDHAATVAAVAAIAASGTRVYVIGIPGSQPYASVLTDMAFAGGAAMTSVPFYYDVQDLSTLGTVLSAIAGGAVPCDVTVDDPPSTPDDTNVYLDQTLLLSDPNDGWTWSAPNVVTLHGAACLALQSGEVQQVQVVSGCPTQATR